MRIFSYNYLLKPFIVFPKTNPYVFFGHVGLPHTELGVHVVIRRTICLTYVKPTLKLQRVEKGDDNEEEEEPISVRRKYL